MRRQALVLTTLMLASIFSLGIQAVDTTISTPTSWASDDYVLDGNLTIASGSTLTIDDLSTVDAQTYSIIVEGVLIASNTTFFSSEQPVTQGSQGQGMWSGIHVAQGGAVYLDDVQISNAESALYVEGSANLENLHLNHSYIGIHNDGGNVIASSVDAEVIDFDAIRNENLGLITLDTGIFSNVGIGVQNEGFATISNVEIHRAGIGFKGSSGELLLDQVGVINSTIGYVGNTGLMMRVNNSMTLDTTLSIDVGNAEDFEVHHGTFEGERFIFAAGSQGATFSDVSFSGSTDETRYAIDARCNALCSFQSMTLTNTSKAIQFTGTGMFDLQDLDISSSDRGIDLIGSSELTLSNGNIEVSESAFNSQGATTTVTNSMFNLTSSSTAVSLVEGVHTWDQNVIQKPYSGLDHESIGLHAWFNDMSLGELELKGWSTGLLAESSTIVADDLSVLQAVDTGISSKDSSLSTTALHTQSSDIGLDVDGSEPVQITEWTAELHQTPLNLQEGTTVRVRLFSPVNTAPNAADALGDGTFYYGSTLNPTIATTESFELHETSVTFTDLVGNPIEAIILIHGFSEQSNSNGAATLPLITSGSIADVTYQGAGLRVTLYGGQSGQSVQVPVIPSGAWTITSGQSIVLGQRPDGQAHMLSGDLTIETNAQLTLQDTSLIVPSGHSVVLEGSGVLYGKEATLTSDMVSLGASSYISGIDGDLSIIGNVSWSCMSKQETYSLYIQGLLTLQPNCAIDIFNGFVDGDVNTLTGAILTIKSSLSVTVLDKGEPISGATISIGGTVSQTDALGYVSTYSTSRTVDENGETWGGRKIITLQYMTFNDFISWETNSSLEHTFMVSTVPTGELDSWLVLEQRWSPYVLTDSLRIGINGILTINDGVELRISSESTIIVDGHLDAGNAILSSTGGSRWGGLHTGTIAGSLIELSGTSVVESSPALSIGEGAGTLVANDILVARSSAEPLLYIDAQSAATVEITNSSFSDSGLACMMIKSSSAQITLDRIHLSNCGEVAMNIEQSEVIISNVNLSGSMDEGINLYGTTGSLTSISALEFNGTQPVVDAFGIDENLLLSEIEATSEFSTVIRIEKSDDVDLHSFVLQGPTALEIIESSGKFSEIIAVGSGVGTGIDIEHGKYSSPLIFSSIDVTDFAIGMSFHEDEQGLSATSILEDVVIISTTALAIDRYDIRLENGDLSGDIQGYGSFMTLINSNFGDVSLSEGAEIEVYSIYFVEAQLNGVPTPAEFQWSIDGQSDQTMTASGVGLSIEMLTQSWTSTEEQLVSNISITAIPSNLPESTVFFNPQEMTDNSILIPLISNQAPTVDISSPYPGQRMMESEYITGEITVGDDLDTDAALTVRWIIQDAQGIEVYNQIAGTSYNITDIEAGYHILIVEVTDTLGLTSSTSVDFEVTLLDTDRDWLSSCDAETWFDASNGRSCGPDIYDGDDDDDGVSDEKDAFPLDACAAIDTDRDGQPDTISCPAGSTTWLTEDTDDDGDGIPDLLEGQDVNKGSDDVNASLVVIVVLILLAVLLIMRTRKGDGDAQHLDLSSLQKNNQLGDQL